MLEVSGGNALPNDQRARKVYEKRKREKSEV